MLLMDWAKKRKTPLDVWFCEAKCMALKTSIDCGQNLGDAQLTVLTWAAGHRDLGVSVSQRLPRHQGQAESLPCSLAKLVPECFLWSSNGGGTILGKLLGNPLTTPTHDKMQGLAQEQRRNRVKLFTDQWHFSEKQKDPWQTLFQTSFSYRDQDAESTCNQVASSFFLRQLLLSRMNDSETLNILSLGVKPPLKKRYYSQIGKIVSSFGVNFIWNHSLVLHHHTVQCVKDC